MKQSGEKILYCRVRKVEKFYQAIFQSRADLLMKSLTQKVLEKRSNSFPNNTNINNSNNNNNNSNNSNNNINSTSPNNNNILHLELTSSNTDI